MNRREFLTCAAATAGAAWALGACDSKPEDGGGDGAGAGGPAGAIPGEAYFRQLSRDLHAASYGTPQILVDLDRLDANCDRVVSRIGRERYRIVEKSLPSLELLGYVRARTGVDRFLVLHLPLLGDVLRAFPTADVLVGKVQPTPAIRRFFDGLPAADRAGVAARVRFLVDSRARLDELAAFARESGLLLRAGVEFDIGMHRGGVRRPDDLPPVLAGFVEHAGAIRFDCVLGYEGHVTHAPVASGLERQTALAIFRSSMSEYAAFIDVIKARFPSLWRDDLLRNSGGTTTYALHEPGGLVNDVAMGGGLLRPESYSNLFIAALEPALFIAAPVIVHFDRVELPFVEPQSAAIFDGKQSYSIYGGGWAAVFVSPPGAELEPLVSYVENRNLIPNLSVVMSPASPPLGPGDWVFQQPRLGDAIFQFEDVLLVRGGRLLPERWRAIPHRY